MATEVVKQAAERVHQRGERDSNMIRIREVSASRGKEMRAEPISLLYRSRESCIVAASISLSVR
jgi:phage terminase large subunit-like protein